MSNLFEAEHAIDFERRFGGVRRLYGPAAFERFQQAHVCVIGIGGVGSWVAEALARTAIGELTLIDPDHVAESNINRQVHALTPELGKAKVEAMRERIAAINPRCKVNLVEKFLAEGNLETLLHERYDYVVDAIDSARAKVALIVHCKRRKIKLVCVGGAGGQVDPSRIRLDDLSRTSQDPLLSKVRSKLRKEHGFPREPKKKFGVDCVYSTENLIYPSAEGGVCYEKPEDAHVHGLNCSGFGSSACVTSVFGMLAAAKVLNALAAKAGKTGSGE
ncbi:tRNA A37 threonylcarbamoyladenosine dehydratase [Sulfuritortus calidifontis]|uniref:tRNA A37 threonylcarbamoyladenosine dehydratase n=1 Tax=Sulfuritortus calidifontis TaxID=1914471 RepID=A0A4R3K0F2_9PROT|nr:tRNA cyclic N6-threonylcarbamoyladenosine(37) synthase TcdA [Sulfuritortus calidifontis]TCS73076.1 tRNA A37 threonylcarbamoyladenosine dehydratase [Sulfuritortus calidifontis]